MDQMETLTTAAARIRRLSTALVLAAVSAGAAGMATASPAFADEHDIRRERVEREHVDRERREHAEREREAHERWEHQRYVPPRPVYAPPAVVYAQPAPPPGINFSLNIR
jgi:Ni/Co efflux regulator RcnB